MGGIECFPGAAALQALDVIAQVACGLPGVLGHFIPGLGLGITAGGERNGEAGRQRCVEKDAVHGRGLLGRLKMAGIGCHSGQRSGPTPSAMFLLANMLGRRRNAHPAIDLAGKHEGMPGAEARMRADDPADGLVGRDLKGAALRL